MKKIILILAVFSIFSTFAEAQDDIIVDINSSEKDTIEPEYHHANRYLFAPSAFSLQKGEIYYSTYVLMVHDVYYGINDRLSLGVGTSIFANPAYLNTTYTLPLNDKSAFAIGDLFLAETYFGLGFSANLFYGMYTYGNSDNNFSIGAGLWTMSSSDISHKTISPAFNFSAQLILSNNAYLITENYIFQVNEEENAGYPFKIDDPSCEGCYWIDYYNEEFIQRNTLIGGLTGIRYVFKKYPKNSWQFGLVYLFIIHDDYIPDKYKKAPWEAEIDEGFDIIPFPFVSYSRKF